MPGFRPGLGTPGRGLMRRRLLSLVGALGLVTGLLSSGVGAQAATTAGPDFTYNTLLAIFSWSSHDVCYSNIAEDAHPGAGTCTITQTELSNQTKIAVCVQNGNAPVADEQCDITQTNSTNTRNNYALVIQRLHQQSASTTICPGSPPTIPPAPPPCQLGTQRASILQMDGSGSNFGGVVQKVTQSLNAERRDDDPQQDNKQEVRSPASGTPGLTQTSAGGSNFAAVGQDSQQSQAGSTTQTQTANQFAGSSGFANGINQTTQAPGANAAVLGQVQKQSLQSQVAPGTQTENAYQDGDITQSDGTANHNFASGNQFQDQQEQGVVGAAGTIQVQLGDPKCCSVQTAGGKFPIHQATNMFANNSDNRQQTEHIIGNCDSFPNGCTMVQMATLNGTPTPGVPCNGQPSCHQTITCATGSDTRNGCIAAGTPRITLRLGAPVPARFAQGSAARLT